ncbi:uncharacterized protein LOC104414823 isoform X2 [Eucalyptus grandis]|uniref:uncharacterized protein LOC104414823 isoform X2 n=1 Tax=Eucalyptus grandis TaxID=71139 RepID=UPI00192EE818|nr:uncharacterized protein LOC104414823 isoform X2 [Eucalyptus grandis]
MVIRRASFLVRSKGASRVVRDLQPILPAARTRQDIIRLGSMTLSPNQLKEAVESLYVLLAAKRCVQIDSVEKDPVILDLQDVHSTTGPLGTGIAERSTMQREVFEFSMSGLSCAEKAALDMSLVSDLTGLHSVETDMHRLPIIPCLVYPNFQFSTQSALSDFMGDLVRNSKITINSDGRVLIAASGAEMKDLLSIVAEFYLSRNLTQGRKLSMPVPYDNNHLICLETAKEEVDKIMVTDAPLLFPPGQAGGELTDFVIVLRSTEAVKTFDGTAHFSVGAGLSAAVCAIGRAAEADVRVGDGGCAACYTYSCSKGAFVGCSLQGSVMTTRTRENCRFYGSQSINALDILLGSLPRPPAAAILYNALADMYQKLEWSSPY